MNADTFWEIILCIISEEFCRFNLFYPMYASSLLGHSEQVNEQCYTFDISKSDEKEKIVAEVNAKMPHEKPASVDGVGFTENQRVL